MNAIVPEIWAQIALKAYHIPTITGYNRLEPNPRSTNFVRSLKAEVRDPLWMLTRQWQFGEFQGEDAASPVTAQILGEHTTLDRVRFPDGQTAPYDLNLPLETQVERETPTVNLYVATEMARVFLRLVRDAGLIGYKNRLLIKYPLNYPIQANDQEGLQLAIVATGRWFDGYQLLQDIKTKEGAITRFEQWLNDEAIPEKNQFIIIASKFQAWFERNYSQPDSLGSAWLPDKLEYQFAIASPLEQQKILQADQYYQGHLDWFSFDLIQGQQMVLDKEPADSGVVENAVSFIPAPISFKGMPNPRFWMMEEQQTDFGGINASTTGLLHLLLAEFGLIYGNDWFMLPYPMDINTLCEIKGLTVTDVFGLHTLIRPAGKGKDSLWQRWAMFRLNAPDTIADANLFYLVPALTKSLEGAPLEQVNFLRDEMANLVWAVEKKIPSQAGKGVSGDEMARRDPVPDGYLPFNDRVQIRYVAGTTVPENWIPFIPVHLEGSDQEIRLQRAQMPNSKRPQGVLLTEKPAPYYIAEEEVPRTGVIVQRTFQRVRWLDGKTYLWVGRNKEAGKGEGWSNLRFDQIIDIKENFS